MKYWNTRLKNMTEYKPGEQPQNLDQYIKLNTNESPFPPSESIIKAMKEACNGSLKLYPDPESKALREVFANVNGMKPENVFAANGSDEIFSLLFRGFIEPDGLAAFPYPSYSLYYTMAEANGINYDKINLDKDFNVNFDDYLKKKYALVIVCNPNNPTGVGCDKNKIKKFLDKFKGLLVVDEAYVDFYGQTAIELIKSYDNILITRSFSKSYSLAGLRVGLAIGNEDIIKGLFKLKDSYNLDRIAEAGARAALQDKKGFKYNTEMVRNNKEFLEEKLGELNFTVIPSTANFLLIKHPDVLSKEIYEKLKEQKILVRFFEGTVISDYIRVSVGSMMEIKTLLREIAHILEA